MSFLVLIIYPPRTSLVQYIRACPLTNLDIVTPCPVCLDPAFIVVETPFSLWPTIFSGFLQISKFDIKRNRNKVC